MQIGISGINSNVSVRADVKVWPAADRALTPLHGYTFRSPPQEAVGVEVTVFRSPLGVAPELIHYEVTDWWGFETQGPTTGTVDRRQHDLAYIWDMGLGDAKYDVPRNLLPTWRDANSPIGHRAVALREEGRGDWSISVIERHTGRRANVYGFDVVAAETDIFPSTQTIFVDATGVFANTPAEAAKFTTFDAALAATLNKGTPQLIVVEDGQSHTATGTRLTSDYPTLRIRGRTRNGGATLLQETTGGNDAAAHVFYFTTYDAQKQKQFEIMDLDLVGHWDSTTETMKNGASEPASCIKFSGDEASYVTLLRCNMTGWKEAVLCTASTGRVFGMYGTTVTNWQNYGMYDSHALKIPWSYTAIVNSEIAQHPDALCGGDKTVRPWHNTHGPFRTPNGNVMFYGSYFFARNGWSAKRVDASTGIDGAVDGSLVWDPNPCLRLSQNGARGSSVMLRCCTLEGGGSTFSIKGANPERSDRPVNIILGQFLAVMGPRTRNLVEMGYSGATLEAFQAIRTGGDVIASHFEYRALLFVFYDQRENLGGKEVDADALSERVRFRNWSYLNQRSDAESYSGTSNSWTGLDALDYASFTDLKATNYITHSTNALTNPATEDAPIALVQLTDFDPRFEVLEKGYRDDSGDPQPATLWIGNEPQFVPNSGSPAGSLVLAVPQDGSNAIGGATDLLPDDHAVYDLFKGLIAPTAPGFDRDRGPIILTR